MNSGHIFNLMLTMADSSSSDEELELMAMAVAAVYITTKKKKRKHRVWVREIYQNRRKDGINKLVEVMRISNRDSYFKYVLTINRFSANSFFQICKWVRLTCLSLRLTDRQKNKPYTFREKISKVMQKMLFHELRIDHQNLILFFVILNTHLRCRQVGCLALSQKF